MYKKTTVSIIICAIICTMLVVSIPQAKANSQFVIASTGYPDEFGQGIYTVWVYENSTGVWEPFGDYRLYNESLVWEWNASAVINIHFLTWFNNTLIGAINGTDGKNYQQHSIDVTLSNGTSIFSQQNFTFTSVSVANDPMWFYNYYVILDFLPMAGEIYTVTVTYELWW